jgi:hypothetical protein
MTADRRPEFGLACDRRRFLALGAGGLGIALGWPRDARSEALKPRARSVILVYLNGGPSQLETFDPKPEAPREVRGEFEAIATSVPGVLVSEHLPRLAALAHRCTIVRSMSHDDVDHGSATYLTLTGRYHPKKSSNPLPGPEDLPCLGAALKRVMGRQHAPDTAVTLNGPALVPEITAPGQDGGVLGLEYAPFVVGDLSGGPESWPSLGLPPHLDLERLRSRKEVLGTIDAARDRLASDRAWLDMSALQERAFALFEDPRGREAFDLSAEHVAVVDRYGRHRTGLACLLARRLVEAGVPLITLIWNHSGRGQDRRPDDPDAQGWDTHNDLFDVMRQHLLPRFDHAFSALLEDLQRRGLWDSTLVLCLGEFGRAPRIALEKTFAGATPGRKHWANVYSMIAAGAGVNQGAVLGSSDRLAAYPTSERYGPWDVHATIAEALGLDPGLVYHDRLARPFPLTVGRPIRGLYSSPTVSVNGKFS